MEDEARLIKEIVNSYDNDTGMLIPIMQDLQAECGYLPAEQLRRLSKLLDVPVTRIYGVATFYSTFHLAPKGQHEITLCMGTVCHLKGAWKISDAIREEFKVEPGGTTPDRLFTFQPVNCVGACAVAPVMVVDSKYYHNVTPESALKVIHGLSFKEEEIAEKETKK